MSERIVSYFVVHLLEMDNKLEFEYTTEKVVLYCYMKDKCVLSFRAQELFIKKQRFVNAFLVPLSI